MSDLKKRLSEEIKTAMKSGEKDKVLYARSLHAAVRKKEIDDRIDLDDTAFMKIVSTLVKQRRDSIDQFKKGGREDLVAKEETELGFLQTFLPEEMSAAEVEAIVKAAVAEVNPTGPKDMGKIMKIVVPKTQGRADGKLVSELVKKSLN